MNSDNLPSSDRLRLLGRVAAFVIGVATTVVFGPVAFAGIVVGLAASLPVAAWGLAGLCGLVGFWCWLVMPAGSTSTGRRAIGAAILVGAMALAPVAIFGQRWMLLAWLPTVVGVGLGVHLLRPQGGTARVRSGEATIVLYDHSCPMCRTEMQRLKQRDSRDRLRLVDASAADFDAAAWGFDRRALMQALHVRTADGRWLKAMDAIRHVYRQVGLGWLLAPTGWPLLRGLADRLYRLLARHRYRITRGLALTSRGACDETCVRSGR
jgi:predicted DCC family thiol-disulfide oxidoreductase YuxK